MHSTSTLERSPAATRQAVLFTLLICTYNRAVMLKRCLQGLSRVRVPEGLPFEILVVDNASTDDTVEVVHAFATEHSHLKIRLVREEERGVALARKAGILAADGEWLALVDDDILLDESWLEAASMFVKDHPRAGAFGGRNDLEWEAPPSQLCVDYGESLARQNWGDKTFQAPSTGKNIPCGAGLVLRLKALRESNYMEKGRLTGRRFGSFMAGDDTELQLILRQAGWEIWYVGNLRLHHCIPVGRTTIGYMRSLHRGFGETEAYLRLLGDHKPLTLRNRWQGVVWASREMKDVLSRFWVCVVKQKAERPVWTIRLWYAGGFLRGALRLLVLNRVA